MFSGLFTAILSTFNLLLSSLLVDINLPLAYFGFITAAMQIVAAISSKNQNFFHKRFKNRVLTYISIPLITTMLITGLITLCNVKPLIFTCIIFMCIAFAISKGPYFTLIKRYLNSFSTPDINTKIYSANSISENFFGILLYLFASFILQISSTAFALAIISGTLFVILMLVLEYMKPRLGLKPEEYKKSDIEFVELK